MEAGTAQTAAAQANEPNVIEMRKVCSRFGSHIVHSDLDLDVRRGEIFAIVGGSGSGKSVLLREMIMLHRPTSGSIKISRCRPPDNLR